MIHAAVFLRVVCFCTALLVGTVLPILPPGHSSRVTASTPGEGLSPHQRSLDTEPHAGIEVCTRTLDPAIDTFNRTVLDLLKRAEKAVSGHESASRFCSRTAPSHVTFCDFQGSSIMEVPRPFGRVE
jgi:hypothetical protein